ncbi:MAG: PASTA domain-containing protein, partial [Calditrichaeota bacterium]|nr:PASTA domain-containing protein [Calditrichota bacterium]
CRSQRACLLLTNPQTGEISALATHPTFDSNHPGNMPADARKCWPITDCMEFGSTLKILPFAGALLSNLYDESEQIFCGNGKLQVPGAVIHDAHPYSYLSFREVLQKSSNVGTVKIAQRLGKKNLYEMARRFGFGTPTGISFPGEPSGQLPSVHEWSSVTLANIAFGHGLSATPLQLAMAYGAIANGGYLMKPLLVKRIHHASGDIEQIEPAIVRQVLPHSVARTLSDMLASVVESGTGQAAAVANWRVAGKTGTAQKVDHARHQYFKDRYISSFIGFAPADAPAYLLLVVVDDPKGPYYGGQVAAPIFHDVMERIVQCRPPASSHWPAAAGHELVSSSRNKFSDDDGRNAEVSSQASQQVREMVLPQDIDTGLVRVPELEGLTFRHAIRELTLRNLTFHVIGGNEVVCQSPAPGTMVPVGTVCHLFGLSD